MQVEIEALDSQCEETKHIIDDLTQEKQTLLSTLDDTHAVLDQLEREKKSYKQERSEFEVRRALF